ncbi:aminotransferase class I/II-fold pyridoxal phosphate-dependent enzyme [bacterium]|nr:aminotransferase class I/II-fold pyridoxal phosphate-dependent enzyme [bacterium]
MLYKSDKLDEFSSYAFSELDRIKREVSATRRVIDMGIGDPDIPPPKEIQGALVTSLGEINTHRYPSYSGNETLRNSIVRFFLNRYKIKLEVDKNIVVLIGSKEGIFHLPLAILNPGDIGAYTEPGYPVYRAGIVFAGGIPKPIPLRTENNFVLNPDDIPDGTKLLWVNYPNNPTSATVSLDFWKNLVEIAHDKGFLIANDAAYNEIYFGEPSHSILEIDGAMDVAVEFHSLSKTFCMTGWRVGFLVGNSEAANSFLTLKRYLDSGVFGAVQEAAKNAIDNYWTLAEPIRKIYERRVKIWLKALYDAGIEANNFGGTFYVWAKIPDKFESSERFCTHLIERTGIVALPGSAMGKCGDGFVRFSLTLPDRDIQMAMNSIKRWKN